jgi:hypothetical protein
MAGIEKLLREVAKSKKGYLKEEKNQSKGIFHEKSEYKKVSFCDCES